MDGRWLFMDLRCIDQYQYGAFSGIGCRQTPKSQRTYGFVLQALIIGVGTWIASSLPWLISFLGVSDAAPLGIVPFSVKLAFGIGAFVFLGSIVYTVLTTTEEPPEDFEVFKSQSKNQSKGAVGQILENIIRMPKTMIRLGVVQFFSWFAFFSMWSLANPGLTEHVYKAPVPIEENFDFYGC